MTIFCYGVRNLIKIHLQGCESKIYIDIQQKWYFNTSIFVAFIFDRLISNVTQRNSSMILSNQLLKFINKIHFFLSFLLCFRSICFIHISLSYELRFFYQVSVHVCLLIEHTAVIPIHKLENLFYFYFNFQLFVIYAEKSCYGFRL